MMNVELRIMSWVSLLITPYSLEASGESFLNGFCYSFAAAGNVKFFVDVLNMSTHSFIADEYLSCNVFKIVSLHHQLENFFFSFAQVVITSLRRNEYYIFVRKKTKYF